MKETNRHEKIFRVCDAVTLWGIFILFFALPFEKEERIVYYGAQIIPITFWFTKIIFQSTRRQWKRTLVQYVIMLAAAGILVLLFGRKPPAEVFQLFFWELGILSFCVLLIINREHPFRPSVSRWRLKKAFDFSLGCYGFIVLLSSFLSYYPEESFPQLRKGFVAYLLIYLCLSNNIRSFKKFKHVVLAAYLSILAITIVVLVQGVAYPAGSYAVKNWLWRKEAVRLINPESLNPLYHVQFPFNHYHKTALFLAVGLMLVMLQYFITIKRVSRRWVGASFVLTFAALVFTLSRSALFAAIASMLCLVFLTKRKYLISLALLLIILVMVMPADMKGHYTDIFRPAEYERPDSRVSLYLKRWTLVGELIRKHPIIGTGYGWKQFEDVCRLARPQARFERRPHPYSWYLQKTSESGLLGLWFFLLFSTFLLALLYQRWRQQPMVSYYRGINAALITLLIVPYLFGLTGFIYLHATGMLVWIVYGLCASYMKLTVKPRDIDELRREVEVRNPESEENLTNV